MDEVQCGRVGGGVFAGCVFWTASTVFFGGGRGDEIQTQKHTFFFGLITQLVDKCASVRIPMDNA